MATTLEECQAMRTNHFNDLNDKVTAFNEFKTSCEPTLDNYNSLIQKKIEIDSCTKQINECDIKIYKWTMSDEEKQVELENYRQMIKDCKPF
jgi:hypothetical protein